MARTLRRRRPAARAGRPPIAEQGRVRIGLSGWQYDGWQGDFYPRGLAASKRLAYVAERFDTVELNGSFYSLQRPTSYRSWRDTVPADFVFAVKGGRYITHLKRLRDVETSVANFFASGVLALEAKLGPVLWQLPARMTFDRDLIADFLALLPQTTEAARELASRRDDKVGDRVHLAVDADRPLRHAIEVRHASFNDDAFYGLLSDHDVACVVSDSPTWPELDVVTTDFTYVRLHGHTELYSSGYSSRSLDQWAKRVRAWASSGRVYCYFDNDARGRAPYDALALADRLGARVSA